MKATKGLLTEYNASVTGLINERANELATEWCHDRRQR